MRERAVKLSKLRSIDSPTLKILDISQESFDSQERDYQERDNKEHGSQERLETQNTELASPKIYSIGLPDDNNSAFFLLDKNTTIMPGDKINFETHDSYPIKIANVVESENGREFTLEYRIPTSIKTHSIVANDNQLLFLVGRLQNCIHYYLMEGGELAKEAKRSFEGIFMSLKNFDNLGDFLASDRQGAFK